MLNLPCPISTSDLSSVGLPDVRHSETTQSSTGATTVKGHALSPRQHQTLEIIRRHLRLRGVPPSRPEIARELGLRHQGGVDAHLNALARKGWLKIHPNVDRGLKLLREGAPLLDPEELPEIAAGEPIVAEESEPARLHDFDSFARRFEARPDYFLRVRGDSLDRAGLRTGDTVAVRRQPEASDGDLVVARIGQTITLKRLRRIDRHCVELQPESTNPTHRSLRLDAQSEDVEIVGVIVGAIIGTRRE